jgi:DNA-binding IclR family transcriptional regulator
LTDKAFTKGLRLLTVLARSGQPRSLSSLAQELDLTKSNTHRLLATLVEQGLARQDGEKGLYRITTMLWELGSNAIAGLDVVEVARAYMPGLAHETGETVHLSILDGIEVVYLEKIESEHAIRAYTRVGSRAPAWCVATGKIMLAYLPEARMTEIVEAMKPFTPASILSADRLRAELGEARAAGIGYNRGEWREDVFGAAAAIRDKSGEVVAAIGISGPASRLPETALRDHAEKVRGIAAAISHHLGFHGL